MEILHHLRYNSKIIWTSVYKTEKSGCSAVTIRRTNEDGSESYAFSFNWQDVNNKKQYLYSVTIDIDDNKAVVIVTPADHVVELKNVKVKATVTNIMISGIWIEDNWEYEFILSGEHFGIGRLFLCW